MIPSNRQQDIVDVWTNEDSNILISAVAGSGKTSTLLMLLEACQHRTLFVAFNKTIQEEIQNKIDQKGLRQGKSLTMHALGLSAIRNSGQRFSIKNNKNWDLIKETQLNNRAVYRSLTGGEKMRLNYTLIDLNDASRMYLTDDLEDLKRKLLSMDKIVFDIPELGTVWDSFKEIRQNSYNGRAIDIDFADMLYLPVLQNLEIPIYPYYLMIDEAQDLSTVQHVLLDKLISQGTIKKWIAVGDRNQAIYGFTGALSNSFDKFLEKGNVKEMPLDICYRCSKKIVEYANQVYNVMIPSKTYDGIVEDIQNIENIKDNSMIICRNTNPLIELYFKLLSEGRSSYINGSEIMNHLMKFLKPYAEHNIKTATIEIRYKLLELLEDNSNEGKYKYNIFYENFENFLTLSENMCTPMDSIDVFMKNLKVLFESRGESIMLCTIHKSKGLEADVVYILEEGLIPSRFAKSQEQLRQEMNLKYVARTRAREEMYFLSLPKKEKRQLIV